MNEKSQNPEPAETGAQTESLPGKTLPRVRSQFSPRVSVTVTCGESLTQKHFTEEVNINNIMKKFMKTGILPVAKSQAEFGFASSQTFTEAMFTVKSAEEEFMHLPSEVRSHFKNDPAAYLDAASDPEQRALFENFGLLEPEVPEIPETTSQEPTEPPPAAPPSP